MKTFSMLDDEPHPNKKFICMENEKTFFIYLNGAQVFAHQTFRAGSPSLFMFHVRTLGGCVSLDAANSGTNQPGPVFRVDLVTRKLIGQHSHKHE